MSVRLKETDEPEIPGPSCFVFVFNLPVDSSEYLLRPYPLYWEGQTLELDKFGLTPSPATA